MCTHIRVGLTAALTIWSLAASEHRGQVTFGGQTAPGVVVTASREGRQEVAVTDEEGTYLFRDLSDGVWTIRIEMPCFVTIQREIAVGPGALAARWELHLLPPEDIWRSAVESSSEAKLPDPTPTPNRSAAQSVQSGELAVQKSNAASPSMEPAPASDSTAGLEAETHDSPRIASDVFTINGSVNNGASSPFAQSPAFGNNRKGAPPLYTGGIGISWDNAAWDARSYSLTGQDTPKPTYNFAQGSATFGGPVAIPQARVSPDNAVQLTLNYEWTRSRNASIYPGRVPEPEERSGDLSRLSNLTIDPISGAPFPGNVIPSSRISSQAKALLGYYPLPGFSQNYGYNYQIPLTRTNAQDSIQAAADQKLGPKDRVSGRFGWQRAGSEAPNLFQFADTTDTGALSASFSWSHRFDRRRQVRLTYQFSRLSMRNTPFFANRENVSAEVGIAGNNQDPMNWGPPNLSFASGITSLTDGQAALDRNQTSGLSLAAYWNRKGHNLSFGGGVRRQQFNWLSQQNPRGSFTFTGAAAGVDFAGFLLGIPDTVSIAFGNADKYFRQTSYNAYVNDDWRIGPSLTLTAGMRWEYSAPITERYGRLVNLDLTPDFGTAAPALAQNGSASLIRPDMRSVEPRIAIAWRPLPASSVVVRAGYGVYYDTSVYLPIALGLSQQPPLSKTFSVENTPQNSSRNLLTLADAFNSSPSGTLNTFAVDPNFRVGYAQNWNLSIQRDLLSAFVATASYLGIKGTRAQQQFLPNTFPAGAPNPCPTCPSGFVYRTSNGDSTREAVQLELRRRLHNGLMAAAQYTFSKAIDNAATGGRSQGTPVTAQNWLNLSGERGLSTFDQRHLLTFQAQYSSGMGVAGGALLSGWRAALFKEWTLATQLTAGSGLPLTPIFVTAVSGTGVTGTVRPQYTGAPLYAAPEGLFLNPAAYTTPPPGKWGNAGRDSILGPSQFALNASLGRVFRLRDRLNAEWRFDATNPLNHVTFLRWDTNTNSTQFGLPISVNRMRTLRASLRLRF